jgi:Zn-dependent protease with chaperone function
MSGDRHSRLLIFVIAGVLAMAGSAAVLPIGLKTTHHVHPMAALGSLILAIAGFICLVLALANLVSRTAGSR